VNVYAHFVPDAKEVEHPSQPVSPALVAIYIADLTGELGHLARANGLDALGYLLDMARLEANEASKGSSENERRADEGKSRQAS
jgi:hypothetical protein